MAAGNASNTVFTAIPVGEDFYMSFSTERFHRNIAPQDFVFLNFKLYDARVIGDIGNPNPNALIKQYNNGPTSDTYSTPPYLNPEGRPTSFKITPKSIAVLIASQDLDTYERVKTGNNSAVFRGELYGFVEAVVEGEETDSVRLTPLPLAWKARVNGNLEDAFSYSSFWDGYFFKEDTRAVRCTSNTNSPALGLSNGTL